MAWPEQSRLDQTGDPNGPDPTDQKLTKAMRQHIKKIPILYEKQIQTHTAPGRKVERTTHVCMCIALIENCKSFAEENASASQAVSQPKRTRVEIEKNVQK